MPEMGLKRLAAPRGLHGAPVSDRLGMLHPGRPSTSRRSDDVVRMTKLTGIALFSDSEETSSAQLCHGNAPPLNEKKIPLEMATSAMPFLSPRSV